MSICARTYMYHLYETKIFKIHIANQDSHGCPSVRFKLLIPIGVRSSIYSSLPADDLAGLLESTSQTPVPDSFLEHFVVFLFSLGCFLMLYFFSSKFQASHGNVLWVIDVLLKSEHNYMIGPCVCVCVCVSKRYMR